MTDYFDVHRRFRVIAEEERKQADWADRPELWNGVGHLGWPELLDHQRVLLLAEAGSGKTEEMRQQAKRLNERGKPAFFLPLEVLDRDSFGDALLMQEEAAFRSWLAEGQCPGWFFLDSVDELKLRQGSLERAFRGMARALGDQQYRAHIFISCRPGDWLASDADSLLRCLSLPVSVPTPIPTLAEERFLTRLQKKNSESRQDKSPEMTESKPNASPLIAVLSPLDPAQIQSFSNQHGLSGSAAFIAEIDRQNAWAFANRPVDLLNLIGTWLQSGRLGSYEEQHETNVCRKLGERPGYPENGALSDEQLREGAERLALALTLTRTRSLHAPSALPCATSDRTALNPAVLLGDWQPPQRESLLRRGLFDPETYGRIRFHHRSTEEYLAARQLHRLRKAGMPSNMLFRLLFSQWQQMRLVHPTMRPVAAWLSLWDADVRHQLLRREPETLLLHGDSASLPLSARQQLLQNYAVVHGADDWRTGFTPNDALQRLAQADLAPTIQTLWAVHPANGPLRELLIQLIQHGSIVECADIAAQATWDTANEDYLRILAIRALKACGQHGALIAIAQGLTANPENWSARIVHGVVEDLYPEQLRTEQVLWLMEHTPEPDSTSSGFSWVADSVVQCVPPNSADAIALRDGVASLIWRQRSGDLETYRMTSRAGHLANALAKLCAAQGEVVPDDDPDWLRACQIANRFMERDYGHKAQEPLLDCFRVSATRRHAAFWIEFALMDDLFPEKDLWNRVWNAQEKGLITLQPDDREWLEAAIDDTTQPAKQLVALQAWMNVWQQHKNRDAAWLKYLQSRLPDEGPLREHLNEYLVRLATPNPEYEKDRKREVERTAAYARKERKRISDWRKWREQLLSDPAAAFAESRSDVTIMNLYRWFQLSREDSTQHQLWNSQVLAEDFTPEIAQRAAVALKLYWRRTTPLLPSQRPAAERNSTPYTWLYGYAGLVIESAESGWASRLSTEEAALATRYATLELNSFAPFLDALSEAHPERVLAVLGEEISCELQTARSEEHTRFLGHLSIAAAPLQQLFRPSLTLVLQQWKTPVDLADQDKLILPLERILDVVSATTTAEDQRALADLFAAQFTQQQNSSLAWLWLSELLRFDLARGAELLDDHLRSLPPKDAKERAEAAFSKLFGRRRSVPVEMPDQHKQATTLLKLLRCASTYIQEKDDRIHHGVYTPNTRDDAERARSWLFSSLEETPGMNAVQAMLDLAEDPSRADYAGRIRYRARQMAARTLEFPAYATVNVAQLSRQFDLPPGDANGMFQLMLDRLDDLQHEISHHDFSDRNTLQSISQETEMQKTLALRLEHASRNAYTVDREAQVIENKRTDIRLISRASQQRATIEIKLADKGWTLADLEESLRDQLLGQYLRYEHCRAGCLLLTFGGGREYWQHPQTGERLSFEQMLAHLKETARSLERESAVPIRLAVLAIDLRQQRSTDDKP